MENFKNYFVIKEDKNTAHILVSGISTILDKDHPEYPTIKRIAVEFNHTTDIKKRKEYVEEITNILNKKAFKILKANNNFTQDYYGNLYYKSIKQPIPKALAQKMIEALDQNLSLDHLIKFWMNLQLNPNPEIVNTIFTFLEKQGHPITTNGYFLAYKSVKKDANLIGTYQPHHTGPYGNNIKLGAVVNMPIEECDTDQNTLCGPGLHVGNMKYVKDFGGANSVILEVLVNPKNVIAIPADYNYTKMRVSEYYVLGTATDESYEIYLESNYKDHVLAEVNEQLLNYNQKIKELNEYKQALTL